MKQGQNLEQYFKILEILFTRQAKISNPGDLVSAIPKQDFGKRSHSRNPLIFGLFERMDMVEQIGSGIPRIINLMKEAELPLPEFSIGGMFTVTLQRPLRKLGDRVGENISENQ